MIDGTTGEIKTGVPSGIATNKIDEELRMDSKLLLIPHGLHLKKSVKLSEKYPDVSVQWHYDEPVRSSWLSIDQE